MASSQTTPDPQGGKSSRTLFLAIVGLLVVLLLAFLLLRPRPSGGGRSGDSSTSPAAPK